MTQGKGTLVLDLGNSETRGTVMFGKDTQTGRYREREFALSNRFFEVSENYMPSSDYNEDTSTVFRIDAVVDGKDLSGVFVNGNVQEREFNIAPLRPYSQDKKFNSTTTALSYELAMLHAHKAVMGMSRTTDYRQLDITWDVVILLPPGDLEVGTSKMIDICRSVKRVECAFPDVDFDIKLDKVSILPEGFCAYIGTIFDKGQVIRPDYMSILTDTTLILDIGAGTTDMMIVKDNKIITITMHTIDRGGNNVIQLIKRALKSKYNLKLAETDIINGSVTGFVKDGALKIDITDIINTAKDEIARYLIADVQDFFEETEYPIRSIGRLLVCGGGSMSGEDGSSDKNENIKALGEAIIAHLKARTPNVELIELPTHQVVKSDNGETSKKVEERISPRQLNIIGASILAETM